MAKQNKAYTIPLQLVEQVDRIARRKDVSRRAMLEAAVECAASSKYDPLTEDECSVTAARERDNGRLTGGERMRIVSVKFDDETLAKLAKMADKYTHGNCSLMLRRACQSLVEVDSNAVIVR